MVCVNVVLRTRSSQKPNINQIRHKKTDFPIDRHCKIAQFCNGMSIDMTLPKWAIFTMGVYGEIICLLSDPAEISFLAT